jgi:endonuclease/exonuclease/phosphatase family metal-dependent hydrolase
MIPAPGWIGAALCAALLMPAQVDADIRVMTFNIRYGTADDGPDAWDHRKAMLFDVVREHGPDLLGLQEALRDQLDEIHAAVPGYTELGVGREDGKTAGEYSALLFRTDRFERLDDGHFWFSGTPDVPGSATWGNRVTRICTWARLEDRRTGRRFYVYNLHLDHESQPSREKSVQLLAERIRARAEPEPVIVMGDFNSGEANAAYRYLVTPVSGAPLLADTYRVLHPADTAVRTYHAFRGDTVGDKIDYILVSPGWTTHAAAIVRTSVGGRYPSDHFPVTATIGLQGR